MIFAQQLIDWYRENGRDLPWRHTKDPYVIWLSEIILQQTRVEQGMPYFYRFVENFPTVKSFANADEEDILRLWQGLGYYSRARNMHKAAKFVQQTYAGIFPTSYADLLTLPGVGEYTAAAISSASMNEDVAVLDGNVFRVLSRFYGVEEPINTGKGKKVFQSLAQEMLPLGQAGVYNQAIMDFGATVCKPKAPQCVHCVLQSECVALQDARVDQLPIKLKGKGSRDRFFHYFIIEKEGAIMMNKRSEGDVWANLYEFPMLETDTDLSIEDLTNLESYRVHFNNILLEPFGETVKHVLSHQNIYAKFYRINDVESIQEKKDSWDYYLLENLDKLAKHKLIFSFLNKHMLTN